MGCFVVWVVEQQGTVPYAAAVSEADEAIGTEISELRFVVIVRDGWFLCCVLEDVAEASQVLQMNVYHIVSHMVLPLLSKAPDADHQRRITFTFLVGFRVVVRWGFSDI